MAKTDLNLLFGSILLILLAGCVAPASPEQITLDFWRSALSGETDSARFRLTEASHDIFQQNPPPRIPEPSVTTGKIVIDQDQAEVETLISSSKKNDKTRQFTTYLIRVQGEWRVDYSLTRKNMFNPLLGDLFKSLENLGHSLEQKFQQTMPEIERQFNEFGQQLGEELKRFSEEHKPEPPPKRPDPKVI